MNMQMTIHNNSCRPFFRAIEEAIRHEDNIIATTIKDATMRKRPTLISFLCSFLMNSIAAFVTPIKWRKATRTKNDARIRKINLSVFFILFETL